jgi:hypothetical protein
LLGYIVGGVYSAFSERAAEKLYVAPGGPGERKNFGPFYKILSSRKFDRPRS